jgi:hypothetical protein
MFVGGFTGFRSMGIGYDQIAGNGRGISNWIRCHRHQMAVNMVGSWIQIN